MDAVITPTLRYARHQKKHVNVLAIGVQTSKKLACANHTFLSVSEANIFLFPEQKKKKPKSITRVEIAEILFALSIKKKQNLLFHNVCHSFHVFEIFFFSFTFVFAFAFVPVVLFDN